LKRKKVEILEIRSISILSAIKVIYPIALIFYFIVFFFLGLFVLSVVIKINSLLGIYDAVLVEPGSSLSILRLLLFSILNSFLLSTFMVVVFIVVLSFYNFFVSIAGGIKVEVLKSSTETGGKAENASRADG